MFLPDNRLLIAGWPGRMREYSIVDDVVLRSVRLAQAQPTSIQARTDGRLVMTAGYGAVQLWDWSNKPPQRQTVRPFPYHTWLPGAAFSPDGRHFATANPDGTVHVFRLAGSDAKELPGLPRPDVVVQPAQQFKGHDAQLFYVAFSHDNKRAFSASGDGTARIWDLEAGVELFCLRHPARVIRLAVSPEDATLLTGCEDEILRFWDIATGKKSRQLEGKHSAWCLTVSPDGSEIMTDHGGSMIISKFKTGEELRRFPAIGNGPWTPDGKHLLGQRGLCAANSGSIVTPISGHRAWIRDVAVSPDGALGLSCAGNLGNGQPAGLGDDCSARLWDLRTGQQLQCWQETAFTCWGAAFTPGSRRALVSNENTIRVYDIATGKELACLESPAGIIGVAVSPDGRSVIGGCGDGVLRLWRLPDDIADPPLAKK